MRGRIEKKLNERDAKCPFLGYHTRFTIVCEGLIPGTSMRTIFPDEEEKKKQWVIFCCGRYQNCEICRALNTIYEEDGE